MKKIYALVAIAVAASALLAIPGVFRPRLEASFKDLAYRQDDTKTPGLSVTFLGTSTLVLSDGRNVIMTDGFFTRPSWTTLALGTLESSAQEVEFALGRINARKVDAILVAHAHHDHAMDSGIVAQRTGAAVYGSESTLNIARGHNTPEAQLHRLASGQTLSFGDFKVTAYETPHSPEPINIGSVDHPLHTPAKLSAYKLDQNFSFLVEHRLGNVLIVPSANYKPGVFQGVHAPVVVMGIGMLGKQSAEFTERYWDEAVRTTGARLVLPVHWDDFARSLRDSPEPLPRFLDNINVSFERLKALSKRDGVEVRILPMLQEVRLPRVDGAQRTGGTN